MLERPLESLDDGRKAGYVLGELRSLLRTLDYHAERLYIGKKTPLRSKGSKWEVHVLLYEKPRGTEEHYVHRVHHASALRTTFAVGIRDAARQALMVLHHQESTVFWRTQYHHFLLKETDGLDVCVYDKVRNDSTGWLIEQVRLAMATDRALTEAMREIEELHKRCDEQEQVIKDRDDFIAELLAEEDSKDDTGPNYDGDDDWGAADVTGEDPKEDPEGDAPQEQAPQLEPAVEEVQ
jgi:hypothetical protein